MIRIRIRAAFGIATVAALFILSSGCSKEEQREPSQLSVGQAQAPPDTVSGIPPDSEVPRSLREEKPTVTGYEDAEEAMARVRAYFQAIDEQRFRDAFVMWREGAIAQPYEDFEHGFDHTAGVQAQVGEPGPVTVGGGEEAIAVSVIIHLTPTDGPIQRFEGRIEMRRSDEEPKGFWEITSAQLEQVPVAD